jgi:CRISPR-associated protein Cmr4
MKTTAYKITTLSNLHVGNGDINFDIIDNQVQKDPNTTLPNIHSSSLKGAFREHFTQYDANGMINYIFGPDSTTDDNHQTGAYIFFEAKLLSRPIRSNVRYFFEATSPFIIKEFLESCQLFSVDIEAELKKALNILANHPVKQGSPVIFVNDQTVILEDLKAVKGNIENEILNTLKKFFGENLALLNDTDIKALSLPVLARNKLDKGESKNLWYEEVVPKQSKFYFFIAKPQNIDQKDYEQKIAGFEKRFDKEEIIQIGANKSIGYGFCKVEAIK